MALILCARVAFADGAPPPPSRHQLDAQEMRNEEVLRPQVAEWLVQGEAALAAQQFAQAAELLQKAVDGSPHSALPRRRLCMALLNLGRRPEALRACQAAAANLGSGMDLRALVGALVAAPPTPGELAAALGYAARAVKVMDREPWGYAAQCDIMRRLGDSEMVDKCLADLRRVAPHHYETERVEAAVAAASSPLRWAFTWAALGLVMFATLVHAGRERWARKATMAALLALAMLASAPRAAYAADPEDPPIAGSLSKYKIDEANPSASVPSPAERDGSPLEYGYFLMDLSDHAAKATERGDHATAARLWMALYKAVPDRAVALTKACESYEAAGDWPSAVAACKLALEKGGLQVKDFARFVTVSLKKPGPLDEKELADIDRVLKHISTNDAGRMVANELSCNVGMKQNDVQRLEECSAALAARVPGNPQTIYYEWALALLKGDTNAARQFIEQSKVAGASPPRIDEMTRATAVHGSFWRRFGQRRVWVLGAVLLGSGLLLALVLRILRSRPAVGASPTT